MNADILVDSPVYIGLMREGKDPRQVLAPWLRAGRLYNCGVVRAEVLRGMREEKRYAQMEQFFDITPEVPTDPKAWRKASEIGWTHRRKGKWPPLTDIVIAACALRLGLTLVSPDKHFLDIPSLLVVPDLSHL